MTSTIPVGGNLWAAIVSYEAAHYGCSPRNPSWTLAKVIGWQRVSEPRSDWHPIVIGVDRSSYSRPPDVDAFMPVAHVQPLGEEVRGRWNSVLLFDDLSAAELYARTEVERLAKLADGADSKGEKEESADGAKTRV